MNSNYTKLLLIAIGFVFMAISTQARQKELPLQPGVYKKSLHIKVPTRVFNANPAGGPVVIQQIIISSSDVVVDGVSGGGPDSWESGHGIVVMPKQNHVGILIKAGMKNIALEHIEVIGTGANKNNGKMNALAMESGAGKVTVSHCWFHDTPKSTIKMRDNVDVKILFTKFARNYSDNTEGWHSSGISMMGGKQLDIAYCWFAELQGSAALMQMQDGDMRDIRVWGNLITDCHDVSGLLICRTNKQAFNVAFHHNTIVNCKGSMKVSFNKSNGHSAYNNLCVDVNYFNYGWVSRDYLDVFNTVLNGGIKKEFSGKAHNRKLKERPIDGKYRPLAKSEIKPLGAPFETDMYGRRFNARGALAYVEQPKVK